MTPRLARKERERLCELASPPWSVQVRADGAPAAPLPSTLPTRVRHPPARPRYLDWNLPDPAGLPVETERHKHGDLTSEEAEIIDIVSGMIIEHGDNSGQ